MSRVQMFWAAAGLAFVLLFGLPSTASAQQAQDDEEGSRQLKLSSVEKQGDGSRQFKIDKFVTNRAPATWTGKTGTRVNRTAPPARRPQRVYKHVATTRKPGSVRRAPLPESRYEELGVTVWRLRKARAGEESAKIQDLMGGDWWTPERVEGQTPLNVGDRVRLSIESPRAGYLYIISTDQYADGTTGEPRLIFPTTRTRGGDNRVTPGRLVEIPAQEDDTNYFTVTSDRQPGEARQTAEVLTVIVSRTPIAELAHNGRDAIKLKAEQVAAWERQWGGHTDLFEMKDGAGVAWTKAEQEAGATGGRSLTQVEPTPQTIYSVEAKPRSPLLVRVQLQYGQTTAKN